MIETLFFLISIALFIGGTYHLAFPETFQKMYKKNPYYEEWQTKRVGIWAIRITGIFYLWFGLFITLGLFWGKFKFE